MKLHRLDEVRDFIALAFLAAAIAVLLLLLAARIVGKPEPEPRPMIYLETQTYPVAGLDVQQYVLRYYDPETRKIVQVDVRGKENADRVRKEIGQ